MNSMSQRKNRWELHISRTVQIPPFFSTSAIMESPPYRSLDSRETGGERSFRVTQPRQHKEDTHSLMKSHEDITAGLP